MLAALLPQTKTHDVFLDMIRDWLLTDADHNVVLVSELSITEDP
jgi:hypothetical protein